MSNGEKSRIIIPNLVLKRVSNATGDAVDPKLNNKLFWQKPLTQHSSAGLAWYLPALFAQSNQEILVASPSADVYKSSIIDIPDLASERIKFADPEKGDIYKLVNSFFTPIAQDLLERNLNDSLISEKFDGNDRYNSHTLQMLAGELYLLALAAHHHAQVELNPQFVLDQLSKISKLDISQDTKFRLSMVEGLFNLYKPNESTGFEVSTPFGSSVSERLFELLHDARYIDLAHERNRLGLRKDRAATLHRIRSLSTEITKQKTWKGLLQLSKQVVMLASPVKLPKMNLFEMLQFDNYSPALIDLAAHKPKDFTIESHDRDELMKVLSDEVLLDKELVDRGLKEGTLMNEWKACSTELLPYFTFEQ